jgi:hypothetical protein
MYVICYNSRAVAPEKKRKKNEKIKENKCAIKWQKMPLVLSLTHSVTLVHIFIVVDLENLEMGTDAFILIKFLEVVKSVFLLPHICIAKFAKKKILRNGLSFALVN